MRSARGLPAFLSTDARGTPVWQIAQRDYKFGRGKHKSLTKATYDAVADHFRKLWGSEAGWAHSVLFTADLRAFSERLTATAKISSKVDEGMVEVAAGARVKIERNAEVGREANVKLARFSETTIVSTRETRLRRRAAGNVEGKLTEVVKEEEVEEVATVRTGRAKRRRRS